MTAMLIAFAILAALALGFVIGRIWQIRSNESLRRASFPMPSVARIPRLSDANAHPSASASPYSVVCAASWPSGSRLPL